MFTGIIEQTGTVESVITGPANTSFWVRSDLSASLKPDQSLCHNGVCLTVEEIKDGVHRVTAIPETLRKTSLGSWKTGTRINLERCLAMDGRLDGHIVQGHVDCTGTCLERIEKEGELIFVTGFPKKFAALVIEKGSIALDGISLTAFNVKKNRFSVAIIPYTIAHTNLQDLQPGMAVNLEFDILGKYILRQKELQKKKGL